MLPDEIHFIEIEPERPCNYCGRKKLDETDKFYKVFVGDADIAIVVCELCKGGFSTRTLEGKEKSYVTHLIFYAKRSLIELREKLPEKIIAELYSAIENYEAGKYSASFHCIGLVAEWLTDRVFAKQFGEPPEKENLRWEDKLGRLLHASKRNKKNPEEVVMHQLFSLKWFRNIADHPSTYEINAEDVRMGLMSIIYIVSSESLRTKLDLVIPNPKEQMLKKKHPKSLL